MRDLNNLRMLLNGVEWRMHTKGVEGEQSSTDAQGRTQERVVKL